MRKSLFILFVCSLFLNMQADESAIKQLREFSSVFRTIAKKVSPSVVSIEAFKVVERHETILESPKSSRKKSEEKIIREKVLASGGTGFIVTTDGFILTNYHVLDKKEGIKVSLFDGRQMDATYIGGDEFLDIAVIKISATNLVPCDFGNSNDVEVGDWVLTIGNPYGYSHTVTQGIISAKHRENNSLQTSVAMNPGNSGGPLLNLEGKVIGVNRMIKTTTGGSIGLGFAIPINIAKRAFEDIQKFGVTKIGIVGASFGMNGNDCLIGEVHPKSPAKAGGLQAQDKVISINNIPITNRSQLDAVLSEYRAGETVVFNIVRKDLKLDVPVVLRDGDEWVKECLKNFAKDTGIKFIFLNKEKQAQHKLLSEVGLLVTEVNNPAFRSLKIGDVILAINKIEIKDEGTYTNAVFTAHPPQVTFTILRGKNYWDEEFELKND